MTASPETQRELRLLRQELRERETARTSITEHPSLREVEIALRIYELFLLDQTAASHETKTDQ